MQVDGRMKPTLKLTLNAMLSPMLKLTLHPMLNPMLTSTLNDTLKPKLKPTLNSRLRYNPGKHAPSHQYLKTQDSRVCDSANPVF